METRSAHRNTKLARKLRSRHVDGGPVSSLWQLLLAFWNDQKIGFNWAAKAYVPIAKQVL